MDLAGANLNKELFLLGSIKGQAANEQLAALMI
jgi:hypothetical protein